MSQTQPDNPDTGLSDDELGDPLPADEQTDTDDTDQASQSGSPVPQQKSGQPHDLVTQTQTPLPGTTEAREQAQQ